MTEEQLHKTVTVTSKMQLTIPQAIAKKLKLRVGEQVHVVEDNGRVIVTPYRSLVEELPDSLRKL
jgi:AbrB family looped-hinge helix DNA binding protein